MVERSAAHGVEEGCSGDAGGEVSGIHGWVVRWRGWWVLGRGTRLGEVEREVGPTYCLEEETSAGLA